MSSPPWGPGLGVLSDPFLDVMIVMSSPSLDIGPGSPRVIRWPAGALPRDTAYLLPCLSTSLGLLFVGSMAPLGCVGGGGCAPRELTWALAGLDQCWGGTVCSGTLGRDWCLDSHVVNIVFLPLWGHTQQCSHYF